MPEMYPSRPVDALSPRRRRLAVWLIMGCASPTLLGAGMACDAEELGLAREASGVGQVDIKVPTFHSTSSVHSVLGLLPGPYHGPVGSSIHLLPPDPLTATTPNGATPGSEPASCDPVATTTVGSPVPHLPPVLVTPENAKLGAPHLSWKAPVPAFHAAVEPPTSPDSLALTPPHQHAVPAAVMAASRRGFPAWIEPDDKAATSEPSAGDSVDRSQDAWRPRGEMSQPQPLRDPLPQLSSPQNKSVKGNSVTNSSPRKDTGQHETAKRDTVTNVPAKSNVTSSRSASVGSGLSKLSPMQEMPSLENLPAWTQPTETLPSLDDLPDGPTTVDVEQANSKKTNPHDGNNEGDASGEVEIDHWDAGNAGGPSDVGESESGLSTIDIEPLYIDSVELRPSSKDSANQRTAKDDDATRRVSPSTPRDSNAKPSLGKTTTRDATGRAKSHEGIGAVAKLDPSIVRLQQPMLQTLRSFHAQTEKADSRSNWGMMHAIMVYGTDTRIIARRRNYSAIAWMAGNNVCRGNRLMTTERGHIKVREGTGLQGHQAQFLATLSLAGVPANYPLYANNQKFSVEDLVQVEAVACEDGKELTFTLIGLAHYLDTTATWQGVGGEAWDFERLIAAELDQPVIGAACGGTHRLMGFAHALRKRRLEGEPIEGQWKRAEKFLDDFVEYTYTLQNRDGSFSTNWFESPQDNGDLSRKVQTTGHILEFLLTHLGDDELVNDRVVSAVRFLTGAMRRIEMDDAGVGYRAHALRSLAMFHQRVYGTAPVYPPGQMAFGQHRGQQHR